MRRTFLAFVIILLGSTAVALAQESDTTRILTGTLTGYVTDTTGKPVIGATIRILGTIHGGISKAPDGQFRIAGIRAGMCTIRVNCVGYRSVEYSVSILREHITTTEVTLAKRIKIDDGCRGPLLVLVQPERFGSTSIITADDLDRFP